MEALGADSTKNADNANNNEGNTDCTDCINITAGKPSDDTLAFAAEDLIFIGFPVFGGRVPAIVLERLAALKGNGAKAVIVAVYGNRHYDDSIKEMQSFAQEHGCDVVAAIAAVAQHSIAPSIAAGRPDATDLQHLLEFKEDIDIKYKNGGLKSMQPRPQEQYKEYRQLPILPESKESCTLCGVCEKECPVQAITIKDTCLTDPCRCILCMRCTAVCPSGARGLQAETLEAVTERIESRCNGRRETEIFYE